MTTSIFRRYTALAAVMIAFAAVADSASAAELLVFERPGCPYCLAFDREVAPIYPRTTEGKAVPLRRIDVSRPIPPDLAFVKVERVTPTFVLIEEGREIGRFRGYGGDDHFWGLFGVLMARLEEYRATTAAVPTSSERAATPPAATLER